MKILWVGDAAVSTGFARCTHAACDALHAAGHTVTVLGMNYFGRPDHGYPYDIWPCLDPHDDGRDPFGVSRLPAMVRRCDPDLIVLQNDPWNIAAYLDALNATGYTGQAVGWLAVDSMNQHAQRLNELDRVVVWTDWAGKELQRGGLVSGYDVVPLGVDPRVFYPQSQTLARETIFAGVETTAHDGFVFGVVGRNQPRKRLDLTIRYFAKWLEQTGIDDAYLYLHVAPTGERGVDLISLVRYYGLNKGQVLLSQPNIGHGVPSEELSLVYAAMNAYWTTTQGEGWGLPALEAMACGIPCVLPNHSAFSDWTDDAALRVDCSGVVMSAPLNSAPHTIGEVVDEKSTLAALSLIYRSVALRRELAQAGGILASRLTWESTGAAFTNVVESMQIKSRAA